MADRFFIAPYNENSGLINNVKPWLIPDEAFAELNNAYVFRGRVRKRFGSRWIGNNSLVSRLRVYAGFITGGVLAGNLRTIFADVVTVPGTGFPTSTGQSFSVGDVVFTINNPAAGAQQMLRSDGLADVATFNLTTSDFNITGVALPDATPVYFYPGTPVMGLLTYEQNSINDEFVVGFDTRYAYQYSSGWERLSVESINNAGASVWTGDNSQFFWATTWTGINPSDKVFYVTNFKAVDKIRYLVGGSWNYFNYYYSIGDIIDTTNGAGAAAGIVPGASGSIGQTFLIGRTLFTVTIPNGALTVSSIVIGKATVGTGTFNIATGAYNFVGAKVSSSVYFSANYIINTARIIVAFKDRLLLLNTIESGVAHPNRCRYSQNGSPLSPSAWFENIPGKGDSIDAATTEAIITAQFIKDRLIVFFERSTWELVYIGNQAYPFTWQKINTELGAESTFSIVPFDKIAIGVGNVGIHACNGSNVERIDNSIPDTVFDIHNADQGVYRVYGIRDYYVEMVYWTFPDTSASVSFPFPRRILVFNYKTGTWSLNDDSITCFGYFQPVTGITWDSETVTWDDGEGWDSGSVQAQFRQVIGGNQQGYTFICDASVTTNAAVLQITDVYLTGVTTTLTIVNHNLDNEDYIYIQDAQWSDASNSLNAIIHRVINRIDANTVTIDGSFTGNYNGGGLISRVSKISIKTKEYNFYAKDGRNAYISRVDFMVDKTAKGQIQVDYYVSTADTPLLGDSQINGSLLGTGTLDTFAYTAANGVPAPVPFEETAVRVWHPVYFDADGEVVQLQLILNDAQMKNIDIRQSGFTLHAMCISAQPTSYRFQ